MFIKLIIIIFVLFALSRVFTRYSKSEITSREVWMWSIFWFLVIAATLWPKSTDIVAQWVGVGRGADLLVYLSIIVLFFIVFKILVKVEKIDHDITKIVRREAIRSARSPNLLNHQEESNKILPNTQDTQAPPSKK